MDQTQRKLLETFAENGVELSQVLGGRLSINQCEELAKLVGYDKTTFDVVGPLGRRRARWLDAYNGMFRIEGESGFLMTRQVVFVENMWCDNVFVSKDTNPDTYGPRKEDGNYVSAEVTESIGGG